MHPFRAIFIGVGVAGLLVGTPALAGTLAPALQRLANASTRVPHKVEAGPATARIAPFAPRVTAGGLVQVYLHYRPYRAPAPSALAALGASGVRANPDLGVVQAWVPIARLHAVSALAGVTRVGVPLYGYPKLPAATHASAAATLPSGLDIDAEGIAAEKIALLLNSGIKGGGVKIGVISNGIDGITASQNAGYLPQGAVGPNGVIYAPSGLTGSGAEGTAMLEEVHAAAPEATLGFCGPATTVDFLTCYNDFATWGASVIVDDLGFSGAYVYSYPDATSFLDSITSFAQSHPDISLVTATGNDRQDYYQGPYVADTSPNIVSLKPTYTVPPSTGGTAGRTYQSAMDFGTASGGGSDAVEKVTIGHGCTGGCQLYALLTWNDPVNGAGGPYDDLDLFLVKGDGTVVTSSTFDQDNTYPPSSASYNPPAEVLTYTNNTKSDQTLYLGVLCYACPDVGNPNFRFKLYGNLDGAGTFDYLTPGSVAGHAGLTAEFSAAAAHSNNASGSSATIEAFSATGPYLYGDWQTGLQTTAKPDITGIDGITVSGAGGFSTPFYGTSAAAPNVAVVIALLRGQFSGAAADAAGWNALLSGSASTGRLSNYGVAGGAAAAGAGLVDATATAQAIDGTLSASITAPSASPVQINPDTPVTFTGNCAYSGAQTLGYKWTFGGNSGIPASTKLAPDPVQYVDGGVYTVTFTCSDALQSSAATKTVEVQAAATAADQSLTVQDGQQLVGQVGGSGIGGEQVSYALTNQPAHGDLTFNTSSGIFAYAPATGYSGADSFQFVIDNGVQTSNVGTVSITVTKVTPPSGGGGGGGGGGFGGALLGLLAALALVARHGRRSLAAFRPRTGAATRR